MVPWFTADRGSHAMLGGFVRTAAGTTLWFGIVFLVCPAAIAAAEEMTTGDFGRLAQRCAPEVAASTLASIAKVESDLDPLAINDNTDAVSANPATIEDASRLARAMIDSGHSVDLGLMQINSATLRHLGISIETAFDPCASMTAAASVLMGDYAGGTTHEAEQIALSDALSRYNTGDPERGLLNGYVHKVRVAAREMVPALDPEGPAIVAAAAPSTVPASYQGWDVWNDEDKPQP